MADDFPQAHCAFCGKSNLDVKQMVVSPDAAICDVCIMDALKMLVYGEPDPVQINLDLGGEDEESG